MTSDKNLNYYLRRLILVLTFFSIFKGIFSWAFKTTIFEYLDEIIFLIAISVLFADYLFSYKLRIINLLVLTFLVYSILVSLVFGVSGTFLKIVLQSFVSIKFFLFLLVFVQLYKNDIALLRKFFLFVVKVAVVGIIIHLIFGTSFNRLVDVSAFARPNLRYVGFFSHPNHLAFLMVVYIAYILNRAKVIESNLKIKQWLELILALTVLVLTDSRTGILAAGILILSFYWTYIKRNYKFIMWFFGTAIVAFAFLLFYTNLYSSIVENINQTIDLTSHYIRGNMIHLAGLIFIDYFPIGTGAATFGSVLSDNTVYDLYGQAERYYFAHGKGIYDSNIASIIGEYGFIGVLFFIGMFVHLKKYLQSFSPNKRNLVGTFLVVFVFYSITNPMLTNNLYTLISSIVLILLAFPKEKI